MNYIEKEVTVKELRELYHTNKYDIEINTPDGYQTLGKWFDKGALKMVKVCTQSFETVCAVNHLVQLDDDSWVQASDLELGMKVQTLNGVESVIDITNQKDAECYDFEVLHNNHRYYGDGIVSHNSGKSFICSGNIIKHAQKQGIFVILIDSENSLDSDWLTALGVDIDESKLLKLNMAMIDDVAKTISIFIKDYKELPEEDRPKVLFVIDSLGMLMSPTEVNQFDSGDMKGDMGRKAKALKALVTNCVNMFGSHNIGLVATNHTYASQDMFDPDDKIAGGCLTAGHKVQMADGSLKNIEDIQINDTVVTLEGDFNVEKTFEFNDKEVFEIELETGEIIQATSEHKFLTQVNGSQLVWKTLAELSVDDEILRVGV